MPTRLSRFAEGLMEAAWLGAILLVPVFFNVYSSRIFEPDKITLLRSLTLILSAAWIVKLLEQGLHRQEAGGGIKTFWKIPLILPVFLLAVSYLISTILSVTPFTSFWGSYQRLQGTYTTFSYLLIFLCLVLNLRKREQVERIITTAILASLPVSLYGLLQRFQADPIPWGGDVSGRIAANLGNSIFVAAYLIMVFPLTILRVVESFEAMLADRGQLWPNFIRSTAYVFILALQLIAIYFSGSRGPWLGLGVSLVFIWLGLSLIWRKRWLTITGVGLAMLVGGFILTLNIPNGPLSGLRERPEFGRLGLLLDAESRTGRVRTLIWEGASELVFPHEPLEFPDGRLDTFNLIRPLVGYGPESMYVAYNRFYPPELTQVEKRNASPDRSHNETWDSLVITGLLGLVSYLTLFGSLFYFGLKWLGLVPGKREKIFFLALYIIGGFLSAVAFVVWGGIEFLGVALPFGMVVGIVIYLIFISLFGRIQDGINEMERLRAYLLLGLLAALAAHLVEINFGIAIAATRTYFWVYTALLLLVGFKLPKIEDLYGLALSNNGEISREDSAVNNKQKGAATPGRRKLPSRRVVTRNNNLTLPAWLRSAVLTGLVVGLLMTVMGYEYISNASRASTAFGLVWASLTQLARDGGRNGIFPLVLTTWLVGAALVSSEFGSHFSQQTGISNREWLQSLVIGAGISIGIAVLFWLWHAAGLASLGREAARTIDDILRQVRDSEKILTTFYIQAIVIIFGLAIVLPDEWPGISTRRPFINPVIAVGLLLIAFLFTSYSNLRVIQADIAFKTGDLFAKPGSWPAAIAIYNRANDLAPNEDYYYLFLGRAYLEYAKTISDPNERDRLIEQAANDLLKAQQINPLNTDHSANLGRLYSLWATFTPDPALRQQRAQISDDHFRDALMLSPNNARLWDEWAVLYLNFLNQPDTAREKLLHALELDPYFDWTYALLGDYYNQFQAAEFEDQPDQRDEALKTAAGYYQKALELGEGSASSQLLYNYAIALGGIYAQLGQLEPAVLAYKQALSILPDSTEQWKVYLALSQLYLRLGDLTSALQSAQMALPSAPEEQKPAIDQLISELSGQP